MSAEHDGWNYRDYLGEGDCRKLVTLEEGGMVWVGIRAWHHGDRRWLNGSEPERAKVIAWRDLDQPARGRWNRGKLYVPPMTERSL